MLLQKFLPHLYLPELAVLLVVLVFCPLALGESCPCPSRSLLWKASSTEQCCYVHLQLPSSVLLGTWTTVCVSILLSVDMGLLVVDSFMNRTL